MSPPPPITTVPPALGPLGHAGGGTADRVRDLLEEAILAGALAPEQYLNADSLAKQLGVSHIPVREALRSLATAGWVRIRPHQGAFVCARDEQELADLFELRQLLEAQAARLGAQRRTGAQIEELERILAEQERSQEPVEFARRNAEFHTAVAATAQNALLTTTIRGLSMRGRFYFSTVVPQRREDSLREHRLIVDAFRRRDSVEAERVAAEHVASTRLDLLAELRDRSR